MVLCAVLIALAIGLAGCGGSQLQEMQHQIDLQKQQIEAQQRELEQLRAQQQTATTLPPPGSCDTGIMQHALAHGDDQYAAGKYELALGYYEDAARACPQNPQPELRLARGYEAMGNRREARRHYQRALDAAEAGSSAASQARQAISRLNSNR